MAESELRHRVRHAKRFAQVQLRRPPRRHGAKPAGARADVAKDHESGRPPVPAVEDVRAARLFTHSVQATPAHDLLQILEVLALGHAHADPRRNRLRREWSRAAHSLMLDAVHSSSRFLMKARNWPAIMPSMMRWSKLKHMFIMLRTAMPSPMTTGLRTIDSEVRMAAWGRRRIGCDKNEPLEPVLLTVKVPPCTSCRLSCLFSARPMRSSRARTRSVKPRWSSSFGTGTMSP